MRLFNPKKPNIDAVFKKYGDMLYRLVLARLGNDADAQDVVQDVFIKYITTKPEFKDINHEKAWFLRTAINRSNDLARKQKIRNFLPIEDAFNITADDKNSLKDLMFLISQLSPIYKDVVILHYLEGFNLEETAEILNISLSAVKMRLSRAKEMLQILRKEDNDVY